MRIFFDIYDQTNQTNIEIIKWGITSIVSILCIFIGRYWAKNDKKINKDADIFNKIIELLPYNKMHYIETNDFGGVNFSEDHRFLHEFISKTNDPNYKFINKKVENKKQLLVSAINTFLGHIGAYTKPDSISGKIALFVTPLDPDNPEHRTNVDMINNDANNVFHSYQEFVITSKKILV